MLSLLIDFSNSTGRDLEKCEILCAGAMAH